MVFPVHDEDQLQQQEQHDRVDDDPSLVTMLTYDEDDDCRSNLPSSSSYHHHYHQYPNNNVMAGNDMLDDCDEGVREFITSDEFLRAITAADGCSEPEETAYPATKTRPEEESRRVTFRQLEEPGDPYRYDTVTNNGSSDQQQEQEEGDQKRHSSILNKGYRKHNNKKKKSKKTRPNQPKRPISSYNYFFQQERPKVMAEFPDSSFGDIARIIGQRWSRLDAPRKAALDGLYQQDSARYRREVELARKRRVLEMKDVAAVVAHIPHNNHNQPDDDAGGDHNVVSYPTTPFAPVTTVDHDHHHHRHHGRQHQETPPPTMFPHVSLGSPPQRPHMIPPSPTVVGGRHLASVAGLESVLVQPNLCSAWGGHDDARQESRRDGCTGIYPTAGNGLLMMLDEESFARPMTRNNDGRRQQQQQRQQQHFQPAKSNATMMVMDRSRDCYYDNAATMERTVSPLQHHQRRQQQPVPPTSPWQVLEPDATVQVRHPTTGAMECYRVDYQAYVMTQSEAHDFLRTYGYNGGASHEVQLEQLLAQGLRQPPGRLVSSPSSSSSF